MSDARPLLRQYERLRKVPSVSIESGWGRLGTKMTPIPGRERPGRLAGMSMLPPGLHECQSGPYAPEQVIRVPAELRKMVTGHTRVVPSTHVDHSGACTHRFGDRHSSSRGSG